MKYLKWQRILFSFLVLIFFCGFFPGNDDIYFEISRNIDLFGKVYKEISFNYVDEIDPKEFIQAGITGMLKTLDPYTIFIDENRKDEIDLITNGKYGGVGISIGVRGDNVTIIEILDGYSAQRQGLRIGDVLIEAGGKKVSSQNVDDVSSLVKGEPGTMVKLKIVRNENKDTIDFNLVREEVIIKNLTFYGFYPENTSNVYIKLSNFSRSAGDELKKALKELRSQKEIKSIILDLRGNPGGLLDVAVDICDKFLNKELLIVTTRGRDDASEKKYYSVQEPMFGDGKLVVLVNEGSASASEILAGAIQDHDRGIILGTKTFGKGLVQTITPLNFNTSLKITTAKYYTPSGRSIQKIDYSKKNKVFTGGDSITTSKFLTDNERTVFSGGGITPDSIVNFEIEGEITRDLLAKGLFFQFADHFYYANSAIKFNDLNDEKLYNEFKNYLVQQKYTYHSESEHELDKLIKEVDKKKLGDNLSSDLKKIKTQFEMLGINELSTFKAEVIREIREEVASRYLGSEGRAREFLNNDKQLKAALDLISTSNYQKLLGSKNN
ncbi:MAG: peptidase [Ignavibacteria bacterium RIFOXYB2_FULL_35_12]|nr:MAG: peptidase [Ignavibacteria bacterium GWA2_36_19]OGU50499.1 MAG: peptidase [Ignavibacteria bacterium GWC2_35_8]OGU59360.1 MAG: peptidase [Ignavibacteria bacterium GWF2_35_20]OGU76186.1 MAG: peptidase [Ignavibacteria bacterium RBG_16_35_7]OGU78936.1 MAG: peptidase [Ignavibacteria bacterium RIFOXYA2_FULL_35_9]OGU86446.1 MAG: peptidase [Ignavibacteria bacterium RIFOXYA12_FULL_35_25]OGU92325.1 MAG: peptidase [Ignavibacteria bacterium RIFOXYC12_FULL_35_11]OGU97695.1 MAG: peptidase [Ignaviba